MKRGRPGGASRPSSPAVLTLAEEKVLEFVRSKAGDGTSKPQIKYGTQLPEGAVTKAINSLRARELIKEVVNVKNKRSKHYMAMEFSPSDEVSGGKWYNDGNLDMELITELRKVCLYMLRKGAATAREVAGRVNASGVLTDRVLGEEEAGQLLKAMVCDGELEEVRMSEEDGAIVRYRAAGVGGGGGDRGKLLKASTGFAAVPCGVCPRIGICTTNGVINPIKCVYLDKWLDF